MGNSERLLVILRNLAAAHFLSGFCFFLIGWGYGLPRWVVLGVPAVAYLFGLYFSRPVLRDFHFRKVPGVFGEVPFAARAVLLTFLLLNFLFCLLPPAENVELDALNYHLVIPWQYYLRGAVVPLDWSIPDKYPLYLQMAQLPFTIMGFPWIVKIGNMMALPTLLIAAWHLCRVMGLSRRDAGWVTALLSSLALYVKQYGTAMFDLLHAAYSLLAFLYLLRAALSGKKTDLLWGAAILGMACAVKTFFLYYAVVWAGAYLIWRLVFQRRSLSPFDFMLVCLPFLSALLLLLPVWSRNFLLTGNPFYPLFLDWLGPVIENQGFHVALRRVAEAGYGRSLLDFLILPLRLVLPFPNKFDYWTDPILLLFLAGAFIQVRRFWHDLPGLAGCVLFLLYGAFFFMSQEARYLYPFWVLVMSLGAPWLFRHVHRRWHAIGFSIQVIVGISALFFFHRQALAWLVQGPLDQYLSRASYSFVWNKEVKGKPIKQLCLANTGTPTHHRDVFDILYFTVPVKLIQHFHSTMSIVNPRALEGCDAFMLGDQDQGKREDPPDQRPRLVSKEIFLFEQMKQ